MQRRFIVLLVAAFLAPALAGCLGDDDAPKTSQGECGADCDPDADIKDGLGGIRGQIIDDGFTELAGANVTLRELEKTTTTNAQGVYAFNNLEPGTYTVFAQMNPTHRADVKQVEVVAGDPVRADIQLDLLPPPAQPYRENIDKSGTLGCTFAYGQANPADICGQVNTNAQTQFRFEMDKGLSAIAIKLDSAPGALGKAALKMTWQMPIDLIDTIQGQTPLTHTQEFEPDLPQVQSAYTEEEGNQPAKFNIRADPDQPQPEIAYEQGFDIYMTVFYNGEPVPDGYVPGPE